MPKMDTILLHFIYKLTKRIGYTGDIFIADNHHQVGQAKSIDLLMEEVNTPYVFHLEDDWEFFEGGFIERGLELIDGALQVRFRDEDSNLKGVEFAPGAMVLSNHRFSFNPHLRRTDVIKKFEGQTETTLGEIGGRSIWIKGYCRHIGADKPTNRSGTPYQSGVVKA